MRGVEMGRPRTNTVATMIRVNGDPFNTVQNTDF